MNELVLREATDEDIPLLASVVREAFEDHRERLDPPSSAHNETKEAVRQKLRNGRGVVAVIDDQIIGCVFYTRAENCLDFGRLAVLPRYRRQGVGSKLVEYVEERAREYNLPRVRLGVRFPLTDLRAYYERRGYFFLRSGMHAGYTEPTYVLLEKIIAEFQ